ncbi:IclR family transcriptional regulator [soil metagenome]
MLDQKDSKGVSRTLAIFEAFARARKPLTLTELSKGLDVPMSSCLHLMHTMVRRGYAYSLGTRRGYYPSVRMKQNVDAIARHDPLLQHVGPVMDSLRARTRETVLVAQRIDDMAIILDIYESPQYIRYSARVGELRPLYSTAIGKALLGMMKPDELVKTLDGMDMQPVTASTITNREVLERQLDESRERGWYLSDAENISDLFGISAPIDFDGQVFAIAVSGPLQRIKDNLDSNVAALKDAVSQLAALGA